MSVNPDRDWGIRVLLVMESMKDAEKGPIHFFGDTVSKCSGMARTEWGLLLIENGKWIIGEKRLARPRCRHWLIEVRLRIHRLNFPFSILDEGIELAVWGRGG
jgi:hypothetical protein